MTTQIRYVHAGDLTTAQAHALVWNVGAVSERYQEIAIVGDKVIGSWTYGLEWHRGKAWINSGRTDVTPRYRRKGVARALWFRAIVRWKPWKIESTIGTDEGRGFLARMAAEIEYRTPKTWLRVKTREEDKPTWQELIGHAARALLRELGDQQAIAAKQVEAKPLKLLKGGEAARG